MGAFLYDFCGDEVSKVVLQVVLLGREFEDFNHLTLDCGVLLLLTTLKHLNNSSIILGQHEAGELLLLGGGAEDDGDDILGLRVLEESEEALVSQFIEEHLHGLGMLLWQVVLIKALDILGILLGDLLLILLLGGGVLRGCLVFLLFDFVNHLLEVLFPLDILFEVLDLGKSLLGQRGGFLLLAILSDGFDLLENVLLSLLPGFDMLLLHLGDFFQLLWHVVGTLLESRELVLVLGLSLLHVLDGLFSQTNGLSKIGSVDIFQVEHETMSINTTVLLKHLEVTSKWSQLFKAFVSCSWLWSLQALLEVVL